MLTRVVLRRGVTVPAGRLFATSVPRWNTHYGRPTIVEGTATVDADAIKAQIAKRSKQSQYDIENSLLEARNERNSFFRKVWFFMGFSVLWLVLVDWGTL